MQSLSVQLDRQRHEYRGATGVEKVGYENGETGSFTSQFDIIGQSQSSIAGVITLGLRYVTIPLTHMCAEQAEAETFFLGGGGSILVSSQLHILRRTCPFQSVGIDVHECDARAPRVTACNVHRRWYCAVTTVSAKRRCFAVSSTTTFVRMTTTTPRSRA